MRAAPWLWRGRRHGRLGAGRVRHVAAHGDAGYFRRNRLRLRLVDVEQRDLGARLGERPRRRRAEPRGAAGDEGRVMGDVHWPEIASSLHSSQ